MLLGLTNSGCAAATHVPEVLAPYVLLSSGEEERTLYVSKAVFGEPTAKEALVEYKSMLSRQKGGKLSISNVSEEHFNALRQESQKHSELSESDAQNKIRTWIQEAADEGASDIMLRTSSSHAEVRFCHHDEWPIRHGDIQNKTMERCIRACVNSMCDGNAANYSQHEDYDGKIKEEYWPDGVQGLRVSTGPHYDGQEMFIRLLYRKSGIELTGSAYTRLKALGYSAQDARRISHVMEQPSGLLIISGPTGAGKSTTLKQLLEAYFEENPLKHLYTIEDPCEYVIKGVSQHYLIRKDEDGSNSAERRHAAFSRARNTSMRRKPKVVMIGEIRDFQSLDAAIYMAQSGHLVFTTIHAPSAMKILPRLTNLLSGCSYSAALRKISEAEIRGLVHQRLVKKLCPHCSLPFPENYKSIRSTTRDRLIGLCDPEIELPHVRIRNKSGCPKCRDGSNGVVALAETVVVDAELLAHFRDSSLSAAIRYWHKRQTNEKNKCKDIYDDAKLKILRGLCDPEDVENEIGPLNMSVIEADDMILDSELPNFHAEA